MIVESLGGKISVNSEEGAWTEFTFNVKITENVQNNLHEESKLANIQEFVSYLIIYMRIWYNYNILPYLFINKILYFIYSKYSLICLNNIKF